MSDSGVNPILMLGLSLAIGLLIGIERGWQQRAQAAGSRIAGVRTFGILGLLGGVAGMVALPLAIVAMGAGAATLLAGYARQRRFTANVSATTALVGILTLALGYLATTGQAQPALAAAVAVTLLLSMRQQLHSWLKGLSEAEVQAIGRFGLLAAVILPLLPDRQYGPFDAWNPRHIWTVVIFVSGLSLGGYVATRRLGERAGLLATAFTGALVSSTAVTASLARRLKDETADLSAVTAGIALASAVMLLRVSILTAILARFAAPSLLALLAPAIVVALIWAGIAMLRTSTGADARDAKVGNPFDIKPALLLAGLVAVISLAVRWAQIRYGDSGTTAMLALAGLADVDAAVMALSTLPTGSIAPAEAGLAIALPVLFNTLLKGGLTIGICPDGRGFRAALPLVAAVMAAGLSFAILL
jgi:uncharacterized membrane protein (DUF4010 family)